MYLKPTSCQKDVKFALLFHKIWQKFVSQILRSQKVIYLLQCQFDTEETVTGGMPSKKNAFLQVGEGFTEQLMGWPWQIERSQELGHIPANALKRSGGTG